MDPFDDWNTFNLNKGFVFTHPTAFATGKDDARYVGYGLQESSWDVMSDKIYYVNYYFSALNNFLQPSSLSFPPLAPPPSSNSLRISSCLFVKFLGGLAITWTNWSPRPYPLSFGNPSPFILKISPLSVPLGIEIVFFPFKVGISISAPKAAFGKLIGVCRERSFLSH